VTAVCIRFHRFIIIFCKMHNARYIYLMVTVFIFQVGVIYLHFTGQ